MKKASAAAVGFGLVIGAAYAGSGDEPAPETRAYLGLSFGGKQVAPRDFRYGLRVDHDARFTDGSQPAMIQLDFSTRGLNDLRVNGLSAVRQDYRLRQNDGVMEEVVDEPGFFERIGNWFGGLFGGGDAAEETAEAEELPPEPVPAGGAFLGYNAVDWGLVAVGALGLGLAATEVVDSEDTTAEGSTGGSTGGSGSTPCIVTTPVPLPPGCTPPGFTSRQAVPASFERQVEWQQWLDGGTGQMGDLGGAN